MLAHLEVLAGRWSSLTTSIEPLPWVSRGAIPHSVRTPRSQAAVSVGLRCERLLDEEERYRCQKNLVVLHGADPGSVSGEHLGRLAGHRNWKRQGTWVNVLAATLDGPPLLAPPAPPTSASQSSLSLQAQPIYRRQAQAGGDPSESAREWGWVLGALQSGLDPETAYLRLLARSQDRRGADVERYSRRTIEKALSELAERQSRDNPP